MARFLLRSVVVIGITNFRAFFVVAIATGGDAINGCMRDNKYFLASHGRYTEVSQAVFVYSLWHARSLFITHLAATCAAVLLNRKNRQAGRN